MSEKAETPKLLRKAQFAAFINRSPAYVTKLRKEGRLVLRDDGVVMVPESLKLMADTRGARDDVAARWADRAGAEIPEPPATAAAVGGDASGGDGPVRQVRAEAEARMAAARAEQEEMKASQMRGDLIPREDVEAALRFVGGAIRSELDVLPDQTAPLVAPVTALDEVHAILQDACRNAIEKMGQAIAQQREDLVKGAGK